MNKTDLITRVAETSGLTKKDSELAVNAVFDVIQEALANREKVQVIGFGTFEARERSERTGRNPQTGEEITIAATTAPAFKPGNTLKEKVASLK